MAVTKNPSIGAGCVDFYFFVTFLKKIVTLLALYWRGFASAVSIVTKKYPYTAIYIFLFLFFFFFLNRNKKSSQSVTGLIVNKLALENRHKIYHGGLKIYHGAKKSVTGLSIR